MLKTLPLLAFTIVALASAHAFADDPTKSTGIDGLGDSIDKAAKDTEKAVTNETLTLDPGKRIIINGSAQKVTRDCGGLDVTVNGNTDVVTLTGECKTLSVNGNDNTIVVQGVERITLAGNKNSVTWLKKIKNAVPIVRQSGNGNKVKMKDDK